MLLYISCCIPHPSPVLFCIFKRKQEAHFGLFFVAERPSHLATPQPKHTWSLMPASDLTLIQRAPPAATEGMPWERPSVGGWSTGPECWHSWLFTCWWFFVRAPGRRSPSGPPPNLTHLVTFVLAWALCQTSHDLWLPTQPPIRHPESAGTAGWKSEEQKLLNHFIANTHEPQLWRDFSSSSSLPLLSS